MLVRETPLAGAIEFTRRAYSLDNFNLTTEIKIIHHSSIMPLADSSFERMRAASISDEQKHSQILLYKQGYSRGQTKSTRNFYFYLCPRWRSLLAKLELILSSRTLLNYHLRKPYPKKITGPLNFSGKLGKNAQWLSFLKSGLTPNFGEKILSHHSPKKFLSFTAQAVNICNMAKKIKKNITGQSQVYLSSQVSL